MTALDVIEGRAAWHVEHGDSLAVLRTLPDASLDTCVCDPPYGLGTREPTGEEIVAYLSGSSLDTGGDFMGRDWSLPSVALWREVFRVVKPGAHVLAFAGSRTFDLMAIGLRAAGFEMRDTLSWLYGSGFPKSLSVSKAIDKAAGATREVVGAYVPPDGAMRSAKRGATVAMGAPNDAYWNAPITAPATDAEKQWDGWGTALKPAWEPVVVFRKPLDGTVAANVLAHGTGAINVDACRIGTSDNRARPNSGTKGNGGVYGLSNAYTNESHRAGRWPPNVIVQHMPECREVGTRKVPAYECADGCPVAMLDAQSGERPSTPFRENVATGAVLPLSSRTAGGYADSGGASRFFYCAKASTRERSAGLPEGTRNDWPTVKPIAVMEWLVRLVTPPGGIVLDPFAGSGTTGVAAVRQGFRALLVDRDAHAVELSRGRIGGVDSLARGAA